MRMYTGQERERGRHVFSPSAAAGRILLLLFFFCIVSSAAKADVFSLWPFGENGTAASGGRKPADLSAILDPKKFWDEDVIINGERLKLNIALVELPVSDAVRLLRSSFPDAPLAANEYSILMEQSMENGKRRRLFLLSMPGVAPLLQFTMDLPSSSSASRVKQNLDWPGEFPLPAGSYDLLSMRFPKRNATYGVFSSPYGREQVLAELAGNLKASSWIPVSSESKDGTPAAGGEFFMRESPPALMLVGTVPSKQGTRVTLYMRPLPAAAAASAAAAGGEEGAGK